MIECSGSFIISQGQNDLFAKLSGDFNPLHVDRNYARRLQFGRPVIHGVHHLLRVIDESLAALPELTSLSILSLRGRFQNPAWVGHEVIYSSSYNPDDYLLSISASCDDRSIIDIKLKLKSAHTPVQIIDLENNCPPHEAPLEQEFPPVNPSGTLGLYLELDVLASLFPRLARSFPPIQLAQILSTTRVVGMRCPGLHSIFSGLSLNFDAPGEKGGKLHYFTSKADARVKLLNIAVKSEGLEGVLTTFFRPKPVIQPDYEEVRGRSAGNEYQGQRALVVGGTRGLGEVTAKLLAAGGASVTLTYHQGEAEACRVADEINVGGGSCTRIRLDVTCLDQLPHMAELPTHIYYFASPHIDANRSSEWSDALFQRFLTYYINAFSNIVTWRQKQAEPAESVTYFYPSSEYVVSPERGFAEYATAKGAAEVFCGQLATRYPNSRFVCLRLPRVLTDQTASIIPIACESALDVMLKALPLSLGDALDTVASN